MPASLGTTAQIGIPSSETHRPRGGWVRGRSGRAAVSTRDRGSELIVRDFATGGVVREVERSSLRVDALVAGRRPVLDRHDARSSDQATTSIDGGVWIAGPRCAERPVAIVEAGRIARSARCFGRSPASMSPSGQDHRRRLMHGYADRVWIDVIDVATLARREPDSRTSGHWPLTDDIFIHVGRCSRPTSSTSVGASTAYELENECRSLALPGLSDVDRFAPQPLMCRWAPAFFVQYSWMRSNRNRSVIHAAFDALTGQRRVLSDAGPRCRRGTSRGSLRPRPSESHARPRSAGASPRVSIGTLSTFGLSQRGRSTRDAFVIDPPWTVD